MESIDIIFLLDRSGSMHGVEKDTIGGFNSFIEDQKKKEVKAKVTTILFDHGYEVLYKRKDLYENSCDSCITFVLLTLLF